MLEKFSRKTAFFAVSPRLKTGISVMIVEQYYSKQPFKPFKDENLWNSRWCLIRTRHKYLFFNYYFQIAGEKTFAMTSGNGSREKRFRSTILTGSCGQPVEKRTKRRSIPTEMPSSSPFTETGTTPNLLIAAAANAWLYASIARIKREMAGDDRR